MINRKAMTSESALERDQTLSRVQGMREDEMQSMPLAYLLHEATILLAASSRSLAA